MKIAIDIDCTLHDYWPQFAAAAKRRFGVDLPYDQQVTWQISRLRPEQVRACIVETHAEPNVLKAEPYPGAVEAIGRWKRAGHFIHITSHRSIDAHAATERWLQAIGLPYDELYCSYDKISRCVQIGIDVLVDDSPENLARAAERGITGATLLHPWNREVCARLGIVCADDWPTLARRLQPILG